MTKPVFFPEVMKDHILLLAMHCQLTKKKNKTAKNKSHTGK